jgi:hypothetical protein
MIGPKRTWFSSHTESFDSSQQTPSVISDFSPKAQLAPFRTASLGRASEISFKVGDISHCRTGVDPGD